MKNLTLKKTLSVVSCALVIGVSVGIMQADEAAKAEMEKLGLVSAGENLAGNQGAVPKDLDKNIPAVNSVPAPEYGLTKEDPNNLGYVPTLTPEHQPNVFKGEVLEKLVPAKDGIGHVPADTLTNKAEKLPVFKGNLHIEGGVYNPVKTEDKKPGETEDKKPGETEDKKPAGGSVLDKLINADVLENLKKGIAANESSKNEEVRIAYDQIIADLRKDPDLFKKNLLSDEQLLGLKAILENAQGNGEYTITPDAEFLAQLEKDIVDERVLTYLRDWIKTGKLPNDQTVPGTTTNGNPTLPETGEELPYVAVALLGMAAAFTAIRRARKVNEL